MTTVTLSRTQRLNKQQTRVHPAADTHTHPAVDTPISRHHKYTQQYRDPAADTSSSLERLTDEVRQDVRDGQLGHQAVAAGSGSRQWQQAVAAGSGSRQCSRQWQQVVEALRLL